MIRIENAKKYFNKGKPNEIHAVKGVSLEFGEAGLCVLLGPSGCGKTTLLNLIGGLDRVDGGKISVCGKQITGVSSGVSDRIRACSVGYIFQRFYLEEDLTVAENVALSLRMNGVKDPDEISSRTERVLKMVGIDRYSQRYAGMLSGGEKQKVAIARALVKDPPVLLADEPTGNLDSRSTKEIMDILKAVSAKRLVVLITHEEDLAIHYADRIVRMRDGSVTETLVRSDVSGAWYRAGGASGGTGIKSGSEAGSAGGSGSSGSIATADSTGRNAKQNSGHGNEWKTKSDPDRKTKSDPGRDDREYTSIFRPGEMIAEGFRKVRDYKPLKKLLLLGFFFSALFIMLGLSNLAGIMKVDDGDFVNMSKSYVKVSDRNVGAEDIEEYQSLKGIRYIIPGDSIVELTMPYDQFMQTSGSAGQLKGSLADISAIDGGELEYGRLPEKRNEIAVDKLVLERLIEKGQAKEAGYGSVPVFLGKSIPLDGVLSDSGRKLVITGITDRDEPCIYTDKSMFMTILTRMAGQAGEAASGGGSGEALETDPIAAVESAMLVDFNEFKGSIKSIKDYQVIVSDAYRKIIKVGSKTQRKVNGRRLRVAGYYKSKDGSGNDLMLVNTRTLLASVLDGSKGFVACGDDKVEVKSALEAEGLTVTDPYENARSKYLESKEKGMRSSLLLALAVLIISIVEIYLIMRASFMSRIREVGVYRAVGVKKMDVRRIFLGEILAITVMAGIPGYAFGCYMLYRIIQSQTLGANFVFSPLIAAAGLGIIFLVNIFFGMLPLVRTLRQKPADILSRVDA